MRSLIGRHVEDRQATWGQLLTSTSESLLDFARRELRRTGLTHRLTADDIFQEACLVAWALESTFVGADPAEFVVWMKRIIRHKALNLRRFTFSRKRASGPTVVLEEVIVGEQELVRVIWPMPVPNEEPVLRLSIQEAIAHLPPEKARVIRLVDLEELSLETAADHLGISGDAAEKRRLTGLKTLARYLTKGDNPS